MDDTMNIAASLAVTWAILLAPPAAIRALRGRPLAKMTAGVTMLALFFGYHIIFAALGSQSTGHPAITLGAIAGFFVLRWQTSSSASASTSAQRRALGYDD